MLSPLKQEIINDVRLTLGEGLVDVYLDPEHYELALKLAFERYRLRSVNSTEERFAFLEVQPGQRDYYLPEEVILVKNIFRRGTTGTISGQGLNFDPFASAFVNQFVLTGGGSTDLVTYELFSGFQEIIGRMFGLYVTFQYDPTSRRLSLDRDIRNVESILLHIHNTRPDDIILKDIYARPWIREYTVAKCKMMLGEAYSKFSTIAGPQGGGSLNGAELKADAKEMMITLEEELKNQMDSNMGYGFIIG